MNLSHASRYALEALDYLARHKGAAPVPSHLIAAERKVPEQYLLRVMLSLVTAGLLVSGRGPSGGYRLARPPAKITLLDVVEAVEGPVRGLAPMSQDIGREASAFDARLQEECDRATELTRDVLRKVSVADLAGGM